MQPVQLSLMPDQAPAPPDLLAGAPPDRSVAAATALLAGVIAKAAGQPGRGDRR